MKQALHPSRLHAERGAATLVVVMVLFLVMALLAAYANRSLMFEQRISGSYYRASMAQEMSEGGIDWTLAMLNGQAIDNNCAPTNVSAGGLRFVDKYLNVSGSDRLNASKMVLPNKNTDYVVDCSQTATGLVCRCPMPNTRTPQPATALSGALVPSVGIAVGTDVGTRYGNFLVASSGCTDSSIDNCAVVHERSQRTAALSYQSNSMGFVAAVPSSPAAPLTVKGNLLTSGAGGLGLHNTDPRSAGLLVVSSGVAPALNDDRMDSVPGTPPNQARLFEDSYLQGLPAGTTGNTMFFRNFMGMAPSRYPNHPAARAVTCTGGDCGPDLVAAVDAGQRILTVDRAMALGSNVTIGSAMAPVVIVVNGNVNIDGGLQLNGMLVVLGNLTWTNNTAVASQVTGMVVVQGTMTTVGRMDIIYSQSIASELRNRLGSYARVPGGWIDADSQ